MAQKQYDRHCRFCKVVLRNWRNTNQVGCHKAECPDCCKVTISCEPYNPKKK